MGGIAGKFVQWAEFFYPRTHERVLGHHGPDDAGVHVEGVDRAGMYDSLEVRVPFLDTDVVEYALSLPRSYKITSRERKRVLRRAFQDVLPPKIRKLGKQGFGIPIGEWLRGPMAVEFRETVRSGPTRLLDTADVHSVYEQHREGHRNYTKFLWNVYVYARWAKRMDDRGVPL